MAESIAEEIEKIVQKHTISIEVFGITETVVPEENLKALHQEVTEYIDGIFKACQYRAKRTTGDTQLVSDDEIEVIVMEVSSQHTHADRIIPSAEVKLLLPHIDGRVTKLLGDMLSKQETVVLKLKDPNSVELKPKPSATQFDPSRSITPENNYRAFRNRSYSSSPHDMQTEMDYDAIIDAPVWGHDD